MPWHAGGTFLGSPLAYAIFGLVAPGQGPESRNEISLYRIWGRQTNSRARSHGDGSRKASLATLGAG